MNNKLTLKKIQRNETQNYGTPLVETCWCWCICFSTYSSNMYGLDVVDLAEDNMPPI